MIKGILFDLDGTLAHTAPDFILAVNAYRQENDMPPLPGKVIEDHINNGLAALVKLVHDNPAPHHVKRLGDLYYDVIGQEGHLYHGIDIVLEYLAKKDIAWGVVTNKHTRFTEKVMANLPVQAGIVISGDTFSVAKPHPLPLLNAAQALHIPKEHCLMIGDGERDIQAAHAADMKGLIAGYGYIPATEHPQTWGAPIITHPLEVIKWIETAL